MFAADYYWRTSDSYHSAASLMVNIHRVSGQYPAANFLYRFMLENKKAYFDYEIFEQLECGMVLEGWEVKSVAAMQCSIVGSFCKVHNGEVFLFGSSIGAVPNDINRVRKLLLHKKEISRLIGKTQEKNLTVVPLKLYNKKGKFKLLVGIARGKKKHDKREAEKARSIDNENRRIIKSQKLGA